MSDLVDDSAEWIIGQLTEEAKLVGQPLSDDDIALLHLPVVLAEGDDKRPAVFALNNRLVPLARQRMVRAKAMGQPCTKVRRGLRVPADWYFHYTQIVGNAYPGVVSPIMHNVMLANAMSGEQKNWTSK
jgi:hypothetical protein